MFAIAFWNINKNVGAAGAVVELADRLVSDAAVSGANHELIFCLAEPGGIEAIAILAALKAALPHHTWWSTASVGGRFVCFGTISHTTVSFSGVVAGCLPCSVTRAAKDGTLHEYAVWFVHLTSPLGADDPASHHVSVGTELRLAIEEAEGVRNDDKTIAIGDFNMQPFSPGMTSPTSLNAAACKSIAKKRQRIVRGLPYSYFFNPMWEQLGSVSPTRHPGTFNKMYSGNSIAWHMYDQVIVRPSLMDSITLNTPCVITSTGTTSLLTKQKSIRATISDHLPVMVSIKV